MRDYHHHSFLWDVFAAETQNDYCTHIICLYLVSHVFCFLAVMPSDCVRSSGVGYRGVQQSSSSGLSCLNWTNTTRDYDLGTYPDSQTGKETSFKKQTLLFLFSTD